MKINWFPGHMNKALRDIAEQLKKVDVVLYLLDARIPLSSMNPSLSNLTQNKPTLYVFNKIDMADENKIKALLPQFRSQNSDYILFNSTLSGKSDALIAKIKKLASGKIEKYKSKGIKPTIRTMVVGIPNCGKSTLVNNLSKKAKTITGNKAGVTKKGLWLPLGDGIEIYDTEKIKKLRKNLLMWAVLEMKFWIFTNFLSNFWLFLKISIQMLFLKDIKMPKQSRISHFQENMFCLAEMLMLTGQQEWLLMILESVESENLHWTRLCINLRMLETKLRALAAKFLLPIF